MGSANSANLACRVHIAEVQNLKHLFTKRKQAVKNEIGSIRLRDLEIFVEVARARSIREVARRLDLTSGQVSKIIQSLELRLGSKLFRRSVSGVLLTSQGSELQGVVQELLNSSERLVSLTANREKSSFKRLLAIAGTSFLNTHLTTPVVCRSAHLFEATNFRFLDLAPDQIIPVGLRNGFEMAVHFGTLSWPGTWTTQSLGKSRWVLCARQDHRLPRRPSLPQILEYPFVVPTYWTADGLVRGNDQFPIDIKKRKMGFETATADAAVPILLESDHLAFLPNLLVQPFIERKQLREVRAPDLPIVSRELFLTAKADAVPAKAFATLVKTLSQAMN